MAALDFDYNANALWGGSYNGTGGIWRHTAVAGWTHWFDGTDLYAGTFVHETEEPDNWDGLAVMPDGSLYFGSDAGFNLFHVDATQLQDPVKLADSLVVAFPKSGVEVNGDYLFLASVTEARMYVYRRSGKYPLGYFSMRNHLGGIALVEDVDLRQDGSHLYLLGAPEVTQLQLQNPSHNILQWDVKSLTVDTDGDGVPNVIDNCPTTPNANQQDFNSDGAGDLCDSTADPDHDGWPSVVDNCPSVANGRQADADRDGRGDACDDITQCFGAEIQQGLDNGVIDIAIADLDNDGDGDVVSLHQREFGGPLGTPVRRLDIVAIRWSGTHGSVGNLSEPTNYAVATGGTSRDLVLADINADGFTDIAVVHDDAGPGDGGYQPAEPPGVTVLWNDYANHFGELDHFQLPFNEESGPLSSGHPVAMFAIQVDGPNEPFPELVVVGNHHFLGSQQGTITIVRYDSANGGSFTAESPIGLSGGVPLHAISMSPENGKPECDIAILKNDQTVAIHRCRPTVAPFFEATGYGAQIIGSNQPANGRNLAYGLFRHSNFLDLVVIPDEGGNGSRVINLFINNRDAGTLTLGNGGVPQQLTTRDEGRMWGLIRYPSSPYDGVLVLNDEFPPDTLGGAVGGAQVSRFHATGLGVGTLDVTNREDLADNSEDPTKAVMALGDLSRSCGRDLLVGDNYIGPFSVPSPGEPALQRLSYARCPFDSASRSFERPAPATPNCALIADVDGANGADLIVGTATDAAQSGTGRVMVFLQTPGIPNRFAYPPLDNTHAGEEYLPQINGVDANAQILAMQTGRFGPNNLPDLAIGFMDNGSQQQYVQTFDRRTSGAFTVMSEVEIGLSYVVGQIKALATGDFDDDGGEDVIVLTDNENQTQGFNLFLCRGQSGNVPLGAPEVIDHGTLYTGAQLSPVINATTGRLDLVTLLPIGANPPAVRILQNLGGGSFGSPTDLLIDTPTGGTDSRPVAVATGHVQSIDAPYIACADADNRRIVVFVDFGNGYELASSIAVSNSEQIHPTSIVTADLEADGDDDLVVGFDSGNTVMLLTCLGRGRFASMTLPSGARPRFVTAGDVDGNGLPDILEAGGFDASESHLRVIFSNCGGN